MHFSVPARSELSFYPSGNILYNGTMRQLSIPHQYQIQPWYSPVVADRLTANTGTPNNNNMTLEDKKNDRWYEIVCGSYASVDCVRILVLAIIAIMLFTG